MKHLFLSTLLLGVCSCELLQEPIEVIDPIAKDPVCTDTLCLAAGHALDAQHSYSKVILFPKYWHYYDYELVYYSVVIDGEDILPGPQGYIPEGNVNCDPSDTYSDQEIHYQFTSSDSVLVKIWVADFHGYPAINQEYWLKPTTEECTILPLIQDAEWDSLHNQLYPEYLEPW